MSIKDFWLWFWKKVKVLVQEMTWHQSPEPNVAACHWTIHWCGSWGHTPFMFRTWRWKDSFRERLLHFPEKRVKVNSYKNEPTTWIPAGLIKSIEFRDKLCERLKIIPNTMWHSGETQFKNLQLCEVKYQFMFNFHYLWCIGSLQGIHSNSIFIQEPGLLMSFI